MITLSRKQRVALRRLYYRMKAGDHPTQLSYRAFRATVQPGPGCIMVPWPQINVWMGIETDGYTHS